LIWLNSLVHSISNCPRFADLLEKSRSLAFRTGGLESCLTDAASQAGGWALGKDECAD
jgi:hypothetical protein